MQEKWTKDLPLYRPPGKRSVGRALSQLKSFSLKMISLPLCECDTDPCNSAGSEGCCRDTSLFMFSGSIVVGKSQQTIVTVFSFCFGGLGGSGKDPARICFGGLGGADPLGRLCTFNEFLLLVACLLRSALSSSRVSARLSSYVEGSRLLRTVDSRPGKGIITSCPSNMPLM